MNPYYVKRYYYLNKLGKGSVNRRTVNFIASANSQVVDISNPQQLTKWKRENYWFGISTCSEGEITHLEVSDGRHTGIDGISAKGCGFGGILAYLCFRNIEHYNALPTSQAHQQHTTFGYDIRRDRHWEQGNMPELRQGLVFRHCRRIIHVNVNQGTVYDRRKPITLQGALLVGAIAAGYRHLIAYDTSPCDQDCCAYEGPHPGGTWQQAGRGSWLKGKIFWLQGILYDFNQRNVPHLDPNTGLNINTTQTKAHTHTFSEHHGNYWYFCSMVPNS